MAQITKLVDDINGNDADMTLSFGLDGTEYEIDLCDVNYEAYRNTLELLAAHGRVVVRDKPKVKRTLSTGKKTGTANKTTEMREWLRAQGHEVSDRGRVPQRLVELYETRSRMPEAPKDEKTPEKAPEAPETADEDKAAEQAVIARVKSTSRKPSRKAFGKDVTKDVPAVRELLKLDGGNA